ncbi:hypothetical protein [Stenotrophomonas oahuensis]|uniref:Uncharacterized protein n=1 Tax=Stenotrophomonas oahuensis TaxID=3003271 RepID=A0ABY9YPJ0_9GAMM|nr:hypothetical protein [Stenotrophomonas sp. A5586]WNH52824.1 hypothetical protein PDM29_00705 [Stenotrophomonas sp. A5586]
MNTTVSAMTTPNPPALFTDLGPLPSSAPTHLWADYVELRAMTSQDKLFSHGFLQDCIDLAEDVNVDADSSLEEDGLLAAMDHGDFPEDGDGVSTEDERAERLSKKWGDIKIALSSREIRMGAARPFHLEGDVLKFELDETNGLHALYVSLLVSSCLRYVNKKRYAEITDYVEVLGALVFTAIMPKMWNVTIFGAKAPAFTGTTSQKLRQLAELIRANVMFEDAEINAGSSGDAGLDVVAWHDFGDGLGQIPVAFAQCGCSPKDIDHKQLEASPASFNRWIKPHHPAVNYYIAPLDFRSNTGHWVRKPGEVVLIDRSRIVNILKNYNQTVTYSAPAFVTEAVAYQVSTGA